MVGTKRACVGAILLAAVQVSLAAQSVTVTSPNGGEEWQLGTPHAITWSFQNPGATKVNLILRQGGSVVGTIKSNVDLSAGSWTWTNAGTLENGTVAAAGSGYIVRIRDVGNTFGDNSNAGFTLASGGVPLLQLAAPNGGETWTAGMPQSITWTTTNWSGTVQLNLYQGGAFKGIIASGVPSAPGAFSWKAGETDKGSFVGGGFKVKIQRSYPGKSLALQAVADDSDGPFSIPVQHAGVSDRHAMPATFIEPPPVQATGTRTLPWGWYLDPATGDVTETHPELFFHWISSLPDVYHLAGMMPMQGARLGVGADFSYASLLKAKMGYGLAYSDAELPAGMAVAYNMGDGRLGALKVLEIGYFGQKRKGIRLFFVTYEKPAGGE